MAQTYSSPRKWLYLLPYWSIKKCVFFIELIHSSVSQLAYPLIICQVFSSQLPKFLSNLAISPNVHCDPFSYSHCNLLPKMSPSPSCCAACFRSYFLANPFFDLWSKELLKTIIQVTWLPCSNPLNYFSFLGKNALCSISYSRFVKNYFLSCMFLACHWWA